MTTILDVRISLDFCRSCREQKLVEAEERRKKEEERRLKKLKASEAEQKRQAGAMARKKEYDEAERQKKVTFVSVNSGARRGFMLPGRHQRPERHRGFI